MLNRISSSQVPVDDRATTRPASGDPGSAPFEARSQSPAGGAFAAGVRVLVDSPSARSRYASLLESSPRPSVYQTLEWIDAFRDRGSALVFVEVGRDALVPFVCKGRGILGRAWSLPYDTYGGVVGDSTSVSATFGRMRAALRCPSVRVTDFSGSIDIDCGIVSTTTTHVVPLSDGYDAVTSRYSGTNRRLIRQAAERGVRVEKMRDESGLAAFHFLHRLTAGRWGARPFPHAFFREIYNVLVPAGLATFYLARHESGDIVGGNLVLRYGRDACDWMWVYDSRRANLRVTNALIDRAICEEIAAGTETLNLGASPEDRLGSVHFKHSFGAQNVTYRVIASRGGLYMALRRARSAAHRVVRFLPGR